MRKMQVLGVSLRDYSIRESMKKVEEYLKDGKVNTIAYVTTKGLIEAEENPAVKEFMNAMDLTIAADSDILKAANLTSRNRIREVENNEFMDEFLKKLVRQKRTVYILAETADKLEALKKNLLAYQENLKVVGGFAFEQLQMDEDFVVNEINMSAPNVIISELPSPRREMFFESARMKLNTEIWLIIKDGMKLYYGHKNIFLRMSDQLFKKIFKRKVLKYNNTNSNNEKRGESGK